MANPEYDFSVANLRADLRRHIPSAQTPATPAKPRGRKRLINDAEPYKPVQVPYQSLPFKSMPTRACVRAPKKLTNKAPHALSRLEQLPQELLESIFLECLNVSLPRASQSIGSMLSSDQIYRQFSYQIYCTNIRPARHGRVSLSPPTDLKNADERARITSERKAMQRARSDGLTCRWATYPFFKTLHDTVRKSPNLWLGLFSCAMPIKLLRPPLNPSDRDLLLALASLGAKLDAKSLAHEQAESLWLWAASTKDLYLLQCLMEPRFGFRPNRDQRLAALQRSHYDLGLVRVFKETRAQDPKSGWEWPMDWKREWPMGEPLVEVALCEKYRVEFVKLEELINSGARLKDWRVGFGISMPLPNVPTEEDGWKFQ